MTVLGVLAAIAVVVLATLRESRLAQRVSVGPIGPQPGIRLPLWVDLALLAFAMVVLVPRFWGLLT